MESLRVYVATSSCVVCQRTQQLVEEVRSLRPTYPIEVVDLDQPDTERPAYVFGTPTYVLGGRIVSLGNPSCGDLLDLLDHAKPSSSLKPCL